MNTLDKQYIDLLQDILDNGIQKSDRTGTGTISVFGRQIRHKMSDGFPLLTTKKMHWKSIVTELLWFLRGDTNIKYLVDNDCHIWDGDAYMKHIRHIRTNGIQPMIDAGWCVEPDYPSKKDFIEKIKTDDEFAKKWGELGPIYGKQWRNWEYIEDYDYAQGDQYPGTEKIDQISNLINDLKTNPDSRRLMVNAWNVGEIDKMVLPPCHYGFQVYTRELSLEERNKWFQINRNGNNPLMKSDWKDHELDQQNIPKRSISLMWNQRSCDFPLGIPYNIASYGLLLTILGKIVNMLPDELIGNLGDCHIYNNQIEGVKEQLPREPFELPTICWMKSDAFFQSFREIDLSQFNHLDPSDFIIENYKSHPKIYFPLSN
jgi:thymidylate synthase